MAGVFISQTAAMRGGFVHMPFVVATITSKTWSKTNLPTHYPLKPQQRLRRGSLVMLEQIRTIDKRRLSDYIGTLNAETMTGVDRALAVSVGLKVDEP